MLPRRFALIRHVDYSGAAGTGVIAYGVAFDDGQVVLRWSSAHRATSVLDSVEDLIAAHGHGEATSIEWIDAPPGTAESSAQQGGRRARRSASPNDTCSTGDVPPQKPSETTPAEARPAAQTPRPSTPAQTGDLRPGAPQPSTSAEAKDARPIAHTPQSAAPAEASDVRPAAPQPTTPSEAADARAAAQAPQSPAPAKAANVHLPAQPPRMPAPAEPAEVRAAAQAPPAPTAPAQAGHTTSPLPKVPAEPAQPTAPPPAKPAAAQPTTSTSVWGSGKTAFDPSAQPRSALDSSAHQAPQAPAGHEPSAAPEAPATLTPAAHASPPPTSGTTGPSKPAEPAQAPFSGTRSPPSADKAPSWTDDTSRASRGGDRRSSDDADVLDYPAAVRSADDERRSRHAAIATQPMSADLPEERGLRRPRRAAPTHESPRSIFDEAEDPPSPDLRLASSNGLSRDHDDPDASSDGSPDRDEFGGFFSTGHEHLDTVTGLLDLPESLNKRGRGGGTDQDAIGSRRNGRHRGE